MNTALAAAPSVSVTSLMVNAGAPSSLVIVPTAVPSPIVALDGADSVTVNVSLASFRVSPLIVTGTVWVVEPAGIVTTVGASSR